MSLFISFQIDYSKHKDVEQEDKATNLAINLVSFTSIGETRLILNANANFFVV